MMQHMLDSRYWTKVDVKGPSDCWTWTANRNNKGYGLFRPGGSAPKELAHRLSYMEANGPIPRGAFICHSCDNRACVNPAHLWAGSHTDNMRDMHKKGRGRREYPSGPDAPKPSAKLDAAQVEVIRSRIKAGESNTTIARDYGVSHATISDIKTGRTWPS